MERELLFKERLIKQSLLNFKNGHIRRDDVLKVLRENKYVISVHEHIGNEIIIDDDGNEGRYFQTIETLVSELMKIPWGNKVPYVASVVTTMPIFPLSLSAKEYLCGFQNVGIYDKYNEELINSSYKCLEKKDEFLPIPFAMIDINTPLSYLKKLYYNSKYPVMGLKIHPRARGTDIKDIANSEYLDFAMNESIPILIHCCKEGDEGDLDDLLKNLLPKTEDMNINTCIAHAGMLHPKLEELKKFKSTYIDISPWSGLVQLYNEKFTNNYKKQFDLLYKLVYDLEQKVLYGGDSPFDLQEWTSGETIGMGRTYDFKMLNEVLGSCNFNIRNKVFHENPIRFLANLPA